VVAQVSYGQHGGPVVGTTELTILFHRSVWSVGQVTPGAPEQGPELGLRRRLSSPPCPTRCRPRDSRLRGRRDGLDGSPGSCCGGGGERHGARRGRLALGSCEVLNRCGGA
jgi:hypothetical protein